MRYDLIVLHPSLFLPLNEPLVTLKTINPPTYAFWKIVDGELREFGSSSNSDPYPPFCFTSRKQPGFDDVNPLLVILNAGQKIISHTKKYGLGTLTPRQRELARLTMEAYDLIYYRPGNFESPPLPTTDEDQTEHHRIDEEEDEYQEDGDEDGSGGDSSNSGDDLTADESSAILKKFYNRSTTLNERKALGELLLGGGRCKQLFVSYLLAAIVTQQPDI